METTLLLEVVLLPLADDSHKNIQQHMTWGGLTGLGSISSILEPDSC